MARELSEGEARGLLAAREVGRLGLVEDGLPYVVPIAYAYRDGSVYCHSAQGRKVSALRLHPEACFEVDEVDGIDRWRSVIAWGTYEQLLGAEAKAGLEVLLERFRPAAGAGGADAAPGAELGMLRTLDIPRLEEARSGVGQPASAAVVFRLRLHTLSGRAEGEW